MTEPKAENPKHVDLQQAIDAAKSAADRVTELRQALLEQDEPREWSLSHDGVYDWTIEFLSETNFATCLGEGH